MSFCHVHPRESWVELRLRYLVRPKRGQRTKNELHREILEEFNENSDRVAFPYQSEPLATFVPDIVIFVVIGRCVARF